MNGIRISLVIASPAFPHLSDQNPYWSWEWKFKLFFLALVTSSRNSFRSSPTTSLESMAMWSPFEVRCIVGVQKFTMYFLSFFEFLKSTGRVSPTLFQVQRSLTPQAYWRDVPPLEKFKQARILRWTMFVVCLRPRKSPFNIDRADHALQMLHMVTRENRSRGLQRKTKDRAWNSFILNL